MNEMKFMNEIDLNTEWLKNDLQMINITLNH